MRSSGRRGMQAWPDLSRALGALAALALWLGGAAGAQASEQITHTYASAGEQSFVVPAGVSTIQVRAVGGAGASGNSRPAEVNGQIAVSPGETLYLEVGGNGSGSDGGFNGGGEGGNFQAGGGGGASDIRTLPRADAGTLTSRLLVAAGSGGDGSSGLHGGDAGAQGESEDEAEGGEPGTQTHGGSQGVMFECFDPVRGTDGEEGTGGKGGSCKTRFGERASGGGGGAGLYGGGGGGAQLVPQESSLGAGGGGGSSLVPEGGSVALAALGVEPVIELRYPNPEVAPVVATQPASALGAHTATLRGTVTPQDSPVSACEFEYGTSVFYEASAPCSALPGSGDQPVAVEAPIEGLSDSTTYHFRIVATNGYGTADSPDAEFTTAPHEPPSVSEYSPHEGAIGTTVTIVGTGMEHVNEVTFDLNSSEAPAGELTHLSPTSISVRTPALAPGQFTVVLHDDEGNAVVAGQYLLAAAPVLKGVAPNSGPSTGGTTVTLTVGEFSKITEVLFGSAAATIESRSFGTLTVLSPPGTVGKYPVTVVGPGGSNAPSKKAMFSYKGITLTGVSPSSGPLAGGTSVSVAGSGFAPGSGTTAFKFGKAPASAVECASTTSCTMTAPAASKPGTVDVRASVVGGKGKSTKVAADRFTYEAGA